MKRIKQATAVSTLMLAASFAMSSQAASNASVGAEGVAVAKNGPIEITLQIHAKRIKAKNESLWYLIRLRNVGKKKIKINDDSLLLEGVSDTGIKSGIRLEVLDQNGKAPKRLPRVDFSEESLPGAPTFPPSDDNLDSASRKKLATKFSAEHGIIRQRRELENALEANAKAKKISRAEAARRLAKFDAEHSDPKGEPGSKTEMGVWLAPGESLATPAWADRNPLYARPEIAGFKEFAPYESFSPGLYLVRAIYDNRLSTSLRKIGVRQRDENVLVKTPDMKFLVTP